MFNFICMLIAMVLVYYVLYRLGFMVISSKRAEAFSGSLRGKDGCGAKFTECTGFMKRVIRLKNPAGYDFVFSPHLTKGLAEIRLLDAKQQPVLTLTKKKNKAHFVPKKGRYYLVADFNSASGDFELTWN